VRKRKLLTVLTLLAVVLIIGAGVASIPGRSPLITQADSEKLQPGMSRREVEAILGPPGDYRTGPGQDPPVVSLLWLPPPAGPNVSKWRGDSGTITVAYTDAGQVRRKWFEPWYRKEQGPIENLLWRAKRQWQRWFPG
jgi:hypothetical protein